jgi:N-acetylglutamate synthase-like GNAT family acetyltransferase
MSRQITLRSCRPTPEILGVLSLAMGTPTQENLNRLAERYLHEWTLEGVFSGGEVIACAGYSSLNDGSVELQHIAVTVACQRQGIGRFIIDNLKSRENIKGIVARTDSETTGFYARNGFVVLSTGISKHGVERFICEWKKPPDGIVTNFHAESENITPDEAAAAGTGKEAVTTQLGKIQCSGLFCATPKRISGKSVLIASQDTTLNFQLTSDV